MKIVGAKQREEKRRASRDNKRHWMEERDKVLFFSIAALRWAVCAETMRRDGRVCVCA